MHINYHTKIIFKQYSIFLENIQNKRILVLRLEYNNDLSNFEEVDVIKDNLLTVVYKAKIKNNFYPEEYVVIKKIKKDALKEELKFKLTRNEIDEKDFKKEIIKFNRELKNMDISSCENTVK